jgi:drug/metabolite transporter (DMT)-like permease
MNGRVVSLLVVVAALTGYHLAQKAMPDSVRPAPLFAFVYGVAALVMIASVTVDGSGGMRSVTGSASHWAPWLLVLSVAGIELGVYAMYRTGWSISTASVSTQAIVAAILLVVGLVSFGEHVTPTRLAGLAMCVLGAGLVSR